MRIQLLSDLHLERQPDFVPTVADGASVLVLAGDIGSYQKGSQLAGNDFGLTRFSPRHGGGWERVLFTPGNHEFDGLEFAPTYQRLQATCAELGIDWLERTACTIEGVRFVGTTLWSDFDALAQREQTPTRQLQQREKAFRAANFYLKKNSTLINDTPALAEQIRTLAQDCQNWLTAQLQQSFNGPTVVVTHFAPSLRSADPRYGTVPGTAGFCNALDHLLPMADVWLHGHLHCPNDYTVPGVRDGQNVECRVVANPLGYAHKKEQDRFQATFTIDVP